MPEGRDPDFVIAGAMRSGTTSLFHWLRHHPRLDPSRVKEIEYFDRHYDRGRAWYRSHFVPRTPGLLSGEATPAYLYESEARTRMANDLPATRFIVSLRNPVDRAFSHFVHNRERDKEPLEFEAALSIEAERLGTPAGARTYSYLDRGRYGRQLEALFGMVDRDRVLVLVMERDLIEAPDDGFRRVCSYLGIDEMGVPPEARRQVNEARTIRSPRLRRMAVRLPGRAQNAVARLNTSHRRPPRLEPALRRRLLAGFEEEIRHTEAVIGEPVPWRQP